MSDKITFRELIEQISANTGHSYDSANSFVHQLVSVIESGLKAHGSVSISGFGKFELRWMDERPGRNPQTGEEITIPAQNKVVFKPYKALRDPVNAPYEGLEVKVIGQKPAKKESAEQHSNSILSEVPSPEQPSTPKLRVQSPKTTATGAGDSSRNIQKAVQQSGSYRWGYAAAAAATVLIILLLMNFFLFPSSTSDQQPEQITAAETVFAPEENGSAPASPALPATDNASPSDNVTPASDEAADIASESFQIPSGETLWNIAETQLGDAYLWPMIYELNKDRLSDPNQIAAGNNLQIPILNDAENLAPHESELAARGYLSVYEWTRVNDPDQSRYFLWAAASFSETVLNDAEQSAPASDLAFARRQLN